MTKTFIIFQIQHFYLKQILIQTFSSYNLLNGVYVWMRIKICFSGENLKCGTKSPEKTDIVLSRFLPLTESNE